MTGSCQWRGKLVEHLPEMHDVNQNPLAILANLTRRGKVEVFSFGQHNVHLFHDKMEALKVRRAGIHPSTKEFIIRT